jgi:hypothetical protein
MYVGNFDTMDEGESELLSFDFVNTIRQAGDTLASCTWSILRLSDRSDVTSVVATGSPIIVGNKVAQRVGSMTGGETYIMIAKAVTTHGDTLSLWGHVDCTRPG